jgi:hypothetical protein
MQAQLLLTSESLICLGLLVWLVLSLWPGYRLDAFRQDVFGLRDEMWDYAASGKVSFDDPAYRLLRQLMNGFIRYAHHLTFYRVCMSVASHWIMRSMPLPITWTDKWTKALKEVQDDQVRNDLMRFHACLLQRVSQRLVLGSPVLLVCTVLALTVLIVKQGLVNLRQLSREAISNTVARSVDTRRLEEEAAGMVAVV